ncbi:MAG: glycosyltransferase family 4 protein [Chloroflexota bacterium]|nr:glycosyltransferase family 4 protein [Chloroflexota bacterium]MDQ5865998.1 glycosyltransferase family 4 protein [Chloroflexota bacterium]
MRVAIVTTTGVTRQFRQWPEAVLGRALVARGHTVAAFTLREEDSDITAEARENVDGIEVHRVRVNKAWLAPTLLPELTAFRPDVVHLFHLRNALNWQAALWARTLRRPVVFTVVGPFHDPYLVDDRERPYLGKMYPQRLIYTPARFIRELVKARGKKPLSIWQNFCMHFPLRAAGRLIALSRHEVGVLKRLGIGMDKIAMIPLWVDVPYIESVPYSESVSAGYPSPHVLFLGQLKERKGYDTLARAMPLVLEKCPTATFLFAGQNPARAGHLESICRENGSIDSLVLLGKVDEESKVRLMRSADCLVYPTRYESFGLPPLEAMAAGCPVIATDLPVVSEMVQHEVNGLLVEPESPQALAQAIVRLLTEPGLRTGLVEGGRNTLARYSEAALIARIEALYREVRSA